MFEFITITRALSDENRLRILGALQHQELCVCMITDLLNLSPSTTSKHLSILKQARLIESVKHGKWVYHCLPPSDRQTPCVRDALTWVYRHIGNCPTMIDDRQKINALMACNSYPQRSEFTERHDSTAHQIEEKEDAR